MPWLLSLLHQRQVGKIDKSTETFYYPSIPPCRKLHLGDNDYVSIYDSMYGQRFGRMFYGHHLANISTGTQAESVSQFFSKQDSIRIEYSREGQCNNKWVSSAPTKDIVLDFTLIQLRRSNSDPKIQVIFTLPIVHLISTFCIQFAG